MRSYSSAAGDWVNCGICGEWAHFGCDRRPGLGAFKVLHSAYNITKPVSSEAIAQFQNNSSVHSSYSNMQDYAKTDGLEYICPQCSIAKFKKKIQKITNGYS